jgi:hypothetical protein
VAARNEREPPLRNRDSELLAPPRHPPILVTWPLLLSNFPGPPAQVRLGGKEVVAMTYGILSKSVARKSEEGRRK